MPEKLSKSFWPKSSDKNTSKKEKNVPLGEIVENVSSYLKKFDHFKKYEKDIKKKYQKYNKTTEALPDFWSHDFINKAWRKTETMHEYSGRKKCWSLAILLQVMKRSHGYDENVPVAQSGGDPSANKPVYIRIPFSEMINGKECYRSDTDTNMVEMDIESKFSETDEKDKESKASDTDAMDIIASPKNKEYKLIDKVPSPTQILQNQFYITLYDNQTRNAAWVYEILNKSTLAEKKHLKKNKTFKKDNSVHEYFRTPDGEEAYSKTGYHRGHLAAAANHRWCQEAYDDTYWLSNIIPQQENCNRGMWKKLEEYCRAKAKKKEVRNVHVYTGPLYLSGDTESEGNNDQNNSNKLVIGIANDAGNKRKKVNCNITDQNKHKNKKCPDPNTRKKHVEYDGGKAVPTHLFKVIIVENNDGTVLAPECYKMPNEKLPKVESFLYQSKLEEYKAKIEDIQRDSGLIFEEREGKEESEDTQRNPRLTEEITDATYKVQWRAGNHGFWIDVKVSGSYTDHSDRAVLY